MTGIPDWLRELDSLGHLNLSLVESHSCFIAKIGFYNSYAN